MNVKTLLNKDIIKIILEGVQDGVAIINKDKKIVYYNTNFKKINKIPDDINLENTLLNDIMPGLIIGNDEIIKYNIKKLKKDVLISIKVINSKNEYFKIVNVSENYVEKYNELKILKNKYENILLSIEEGVTVTDSKGNIEFINPAQEKIDGFKQEDVKGKHMLEIYYLDEDTCLATKVLKRKEPIIDKYQDYITKKDKNYVNIVCSAVPLYESGKLVGAAAITKNFNKFKEMAQRILNLQEKLTLNKNDNNKNITKESYFTFDKILGNSEKIKESIKWGYAAANSDSPVLIYGETGAGKEMFAQSIHVETVCLLTRISSM